MEFGTSAFGWNITFLLLVGTYFFLSLPRLTKFLTTHGERQKYIFVRYANLYAELSHEVSLKSEGVLIILYLIFKKVYSLDIIFFLLLPELYIQQSYLMKEKKFNI